MAAQRRQLRVSVVVALLLVVCWCLSCCCPTARGSHLPNHIRAAGRVRASTHLAASDKRRRAARRTDSSSGGGGSSGAGAASVQLHESAAADAGMHMQNGLEGGSSSSTEGTHTARRLQQSLSSQAAPIRIFPELQLPTSLSPSNRTKIIQGISATIRVLQSFLQVRRPVGSIGLLVAPQYYDSSDCSAVNRARQASGGGLTCASPGFFPSFNADLPASDVLAPLCGSATINPAHVMSVQACAITSGQNAGAVNPNCRVSAAGTQGGNQTDMYLYVTSDSASCGTNVLAFASTCLYDLDTNRPTMAFFNVCPLALAVLSPVQLVSTMTHEMTHTLGFSPDLWAPSTPQGRSFFVSDSGGPNPATAISPLQASSIAATLRADPSGGPGTRVATAMLISPTVLKEVRSLFNCSTLVGAALEDQGGSGSAGSHWEYELFQGEIMTAQAPADADWQHLTRLTLALLEDSGWYYGNWSQAPLLEWGRHDGCAFPMQTCSTYMSTVQQQQYFCNPSTAGTQCTFNGRSWGPCRQDPTFARCGMFTTSTPAGSYTPQPICVTTSYAKYGTVGPGVRCVPALLAVQGNSAPWPCEPANCSRTGSVTTGSSASSTSPQTLTYSGGTDLTCTSGSTSSSGGSSAATANVESGASWQCPASIADVCVTLSCSGIACSAIGGDCLDGNCTCRLGYSGADCSHSLLDDSSVGLGVGPSQPVGGPASPSVWLGAERARLSPLLLLAFTALAVLLLHAVL